MDCANAQYPPITGELRAKLAEYEPTEGKCNLITRAVGATGYARLMELCDTIDAVHAELERENERLRKKVKDQSAQLSEVQNALERRNEGELKPRWQKELNRLKAERDSMAAALDAAQGEHDFAPESHYMLLPKDADGVPWHIGDVTENGNVVHEMLLNKNGWIFMGQNDIDPSIHHHHNPDTWEHIIEDALDGYHDTDFDKLVARCKALAGDAE